MIDATSLNLVARIDETSGLSVRVLKDLVCQPLEHRKYFKRELIDARKVLVKARTTVYLIERRLSTEILFRTLDQVPPRDEASVWCAQTFNPETREPYPVVG